MRIKESRGYKIFCVINVILMILIGAIMIFPYLNVLAKSFNQAADSARGGITIFPRVFTLENYKTIFSDKALPRAVLVSVGRVAVSVVLSITVQFGAAYALSQKAFPGKKLFTWLYTFPMFISAGLVPLYVLISKIGLLNNFWVY